MAAAAETRKLIVRAVEGDWVMGDDLVLSVQGTETVFDIQDMIKQIKGIALVRQEIRMEGAPKALDSSRMNWDLNRVGFYHNTVCEVRPVPAGSWKWHPMEFYENKILEQIETELSAGEGGLDKGQQQLQQHMGRASLISLEDRIKLPPPLANMTLKRFIRTFPERFLLELNSVSNRWYVEKRRKGDLLPFRVV